MKAFIRNALTLTLTGAMIAAAASPTFARSWRYGAAASAGAVAGATVGTAAASANAASYGPGYQAYAYQPGTPVGSYGYGNTYSDGSDGLSGCAVAGNYGGKTDFGAC